ncbi:MAG: hypothetical protein HQK96_06940 [Nitrospirae bacterium]|nr:hypothetical protein [Nitrospirota bacterium]
MKTELFVLCTNEIKNHGKAAFKKGHVYVATIEGVSSIRTYFMTSDQDSPEGFPKDYFCAHFKVIFPVMENLG